VDIAMSIFPYARDGAGRRGCLPGRSEPVGKWSALRAPGPGCPRRSVYGGVRPASHGSCDGTSPSAGCRHTRGCCPKGQRHWEIVLAERTLG
jgi:hypothetical protein